jgi:acetyl esterase
LAITSRVVYPNAECPSPESPNKGSRDTGTPNIASPNTGSPNTGSPNTGSPNTGSPNTGSIVRTAPPGSASTFAIKVAVLGLRGSLIVSPRPVALALRYLFRKSAAERGARQLKDAPADIVAFLDERYDPSPDAFLDVYIPAAAVRSGSVLPVVVWVHGGAFVGGSKEEIGGYLRMIAGRGFAVVGVRYALAPEEKYPTPVRQVMAALHHLEGHATRLHLDPGKVVLAGDSAGAQISAQVAALVTNPVYAAQLDIASTVDPAHLRGVALCCGIFDVASIPDDGPFNALLTAVCWA